VVGVTWYESEAYCHWQNAQLTKVRVKEAIVSRPADYQVRLPLEEEWERAARHTDGREYPWGNTFDRNKLNCAEFWGGRDDLDWNKWLVETGDEAASTTIVGQFSEGNGPSGVCDMSGNVWEWTASWYDREKVYRAVRGGSWFAYWAPRRADGALIR
jgi:formylglycine-generating enzyme required for sulfatase activity